MRVSSLLVRVCAIFGLIAIVLAPVSLIQAQKGAQIIQSGQTITGTVSGTPVSYALTGKKGDVFQIKADLSVSQTAVKDSFSILVITSTLTLTDSAHKEVVKASNGTTSSSTSNGTSTSTNSVTLFPILPADGTYTLTLVQANDSKLPASFTLNALNVPMIKLGTNVRNSIKLKDLPKVGSAAIYAFQSDSDFIVNYFLTGGDFVPSLQVQRLADLSASSSFSTSSPLEVVGVILGPKTSSGLVKPVIKGGSLVVSGSPKPYFITVANNISDYDAPSFSSDKSPEAFAAYQISITKP